MVIGPSKDKEPSDIINEETSDPYGLSGNNMNWADFEECLQENSDCTEGNEGLHM